MKWAIASILAAVTLVVLSESIGGQEMPTMGNGDVRIISFERLRYPSAALAEFAQGVVVVRANLDRDGAVAEASAVSGSALLAPAAVENVKRWRFEPNTQRTAVVVYNFQLPSGACRSGSDLFMLQDPNFATVTGCDRPAAVTTQREAPVEPELVVEKYEELALIGIPAWRIVSSRQWLLHQ